jgi:hypothetical protein
MDDLNWGDQPLHNSYRSYARTHATEPVTVMTELTGRPAKHRHRELRWPAGLAAALVLAGGGTIAGLGLAGSNAPSGQAALLNAALSGPSTPTPNATASSGASSAGPAAGDAANARARRVVQALRHLRGLHGEFTVRTKRGGFIQIAFERGSIVAVSSRQVTVRAADGTTWAWTLVSNTVVPKDRAKSSAASLATGDPVFVGGPEHGAVRSARLIIVSKKAASGQADAAQQGGTPNSKLRRAGRWGR